MSHNELSKIAGHSQSDYPTETDLKIKQLEADKAVLIEFAKFVNNETKRMEDYPTACLNGDRAQLKTIFLASKELLEKVQK